MSVLRQRTSQRSKKLWTAGAIGALAMGVLSTGIFIFTMSEMKKSQSSTEAEYLKTIQSAKDQLDQERQSKKKVYMLKRDIEPGLLVQAADLEAVDLPNGAVPENMIEDTAHAIGKYTKIQIKKNTPLTTTMLYDDGITPKDLRLDQFNFIQLPTDLKKDQFVDVRIRFITGQDYIVLSKKRIKKLQENEVITASSDSAAKNNNTSGTASNNSGTSGNGAVSNGNSSNSGTNSSDSSSNSSAPKSSSGSNASGLDQRTIDKVYQMVWLEMDEKEILTMSSAIVDAYINHGNLYAVTYVDPTVQDKAVPTYPVNKNVRDLIQSNPNVVADAKKGMESRVRNQFDQSFVDMAEQAKSRIAAAVGIFQTASASPLTPADTYGPVTGNSSGSAYPPRNSYSTADVLRPPATISGGGTPTPTPSPAPSNGGGTETAGGTPSSAASADKQKNIFQQNTGNAVSP